MEMSKQKLIINIYNLALHFRNAIDSALKNHEFDEVFSNFPIGCCDYASELLGRYLFEHDIYTYSINKQYLYGEDAYNHTWLFLEKDNNIIIDITGDQFCNKDSQLYYCNPVYVGPIDDFHKLFRNYCKPTIIKPNLWKPDCNGFIPKVKQKQIDRYEIIIKYLSMDC